MGYASKLGRARISARNPRAAGVCDRCGFVYNHINLQWQYDWAGASMINKRLLVCDTCNDVPQQQLRAIVVPADPVPIQNPRTQDYVTAETDIRTTQGNTIDPATGIPVIGGDQRETTLVEIPGGSAYSEILLEGGDAALALENEQYLLVQEGNVLPAGTYLRTPQQTGEPPGGLNTTPGTDTNAPGNDDPGLPYENVVVPETGAE